MHIYFRCIPDCFARCWARRLCPGPDMAAGPARSRARHHFWAWARVWGPQMMRKAQKQIRNKYKHRVINMATHMYLIFYISYYIHLCAHHSRICNASFICRSHLLHVLFTLIFQFDLIFDSDSFHRLCWLQLRHATHHVRNTLSGTNVYVYIYIYTSVNP